MDTPLLEDTALEAARPRCKNCGKKLAKKGAFCPHCSQRDFDGRVRMRDLMGKFIFNLTHLDNKFVKMVWHLLVPGKVSTAYFQGKIRRYPHPLQFYFVVAFFFLLLVNKTVDHEREKQAKMGNAEVQISVDGKDTTQNVRLQGGEIFPLMVRYQEVKEYRAAYDSLPAEWRNDLTKKALDSVLNRVKDTDFQFVEMALTERDSAGQKRILDSLPISIGNHRVNIAVADAVHLEPDSIIRKYGITTWLDRTAVRQGLRTLKDPTGLMHYYIGSLAWTLLVLMAAMAGVLWLLFRRKRLYYVEHFIFLLHHNSGELLLLTIAMVVNLYVITLGKAWVLLGLWSVTSLFLALRRFYQYSIGLTVLKISAYYLLYILLGSLIFVLSLLVGFAVF